MSRFAQYPLKYAAGYAGVCAVCGIRIWLGMPYHGNAEAGIACSRHVFCYRHGLAPIEKDDKGICPQCPRQEVKVG